MGRNDSFSICLSLQCLLSDSFLHSEQWVLHSTDEYAKGVIAQIGLQKPSNAALAEVADELLQELQGTGLNISHPLFMKAHRWLVSESSGLIDKSYVISYPHFNQTICHTLIILFFKKIHLGNFRSFVVLQRHVLLVIVIILCITQSCVTGVVLFQLQASGERRNASGMGRRDWPFAETFVLVLMLKAQYLVAWPQHQNLSRYLAAYSQLLLYDHCRWWLFDSNFFYEGLSGCDFFPFLVFCRGENFPFLLLATIVWTLSVEELIFGGCQKCRPLPEICPDLGFINISSH